jgi:type III pantothenate kinase
MPEPAFPLVAVDVGNTRLKLGVFASPVAEPLPHPQAALSVERVWTAADLDAFLALAPHEYAWAIASVNRPACAQLVEWLEQRGVTQIRQLSHADLPLAIDVERPERVGLDRLANAVAVNRLRAAGEPALIVDMGTALKVDVVTGSGEFAGGAILLGVAQSARALHEFTDLLPLVEVSEAPPPIGKSTQEAMASGLYWGAVGAVRELVRQISAEVGDPEIFLTGGAGPLFASVLAGESKRTPQFIPHLTLAGIAIAAFEAPRRG